MSTSAIYAQAKEIFFRAIALAAADREAFLDGACAGDPDLRREIDALLAQDGASFDPEAPVVDPARGPGWPGAVPVTPPPLPARIGRYAIRRVIDSGGMGTIYLAEQESPRRQVALKVMARGIASRSALRRFEHESQLLARLRHPNIAQVYESGTHDDGTGGVPYFAMEYVPDARALTAFAREKRLGPRERLALFAKVCDAVHHGHQKGIIHRDLKPGNILVDADGEPKIIDFGVARATDSDLAVTTIQTEVGQIMGTLQYMSPEQIEADPANIDTRSDVYALGVVLYELLTEQVPYDVSRVPIPEAARVIKETDPARPSSMIRTLRGDVETIVLKALEKDREQRYASANELGADIRRYLADQPIVARPPSTLYQIRKFTRRHRAGVITASVMAIVILVAAVVSANYGLEATTQRLIVLEAVKADAHREALVGNNDVAAAHIDRAEALGAEAWWVQMLRGHVALQRGHIRESIQFLVKATELNPRSVEARGLLAQAAEMNGYWDGYFRQLAILEPMEPKSFEDLLAKGAATVVFPGVGLDLLNRAVAMRPTSAVAHLARATADWRYALDTFERDDVERAVRRARAVRVLLEDHPVAMTRHLYAQLLASFYYDAKGLREERDTAFDLARKEAEALLRFPDALAAYRARRVFFEMDGRPEAALDETTRAAERFPNDPIVQLEKVMQELMSGNYEMVEPGTLQGFGLYFLAPKPFDPGQELDEERKFFEQLLRPPDGQEPQEFSIGPLFGQLRLRLLGARQEAVEVSEGLREQLLDSGLPDYVIDAYLPRYDFASGRITETEFLAWAGDSPYRRSQAHYFIGIDRLAAGDRDGARFHLRSAYEALPFEFKGLLETRLGAIFSTYLERDPDWPPWIPVRDNDGAAAPEAPTPVSATTNDVP